MQVAIINQKIVDASVKNLEVQMGELTKQLANNYKGTFTTKPSITLKSSVMQLMRREKKKCSLQRFLNHQRIYVSLYHFATVHSIVVTMVAKEIF